MNAMDSRADPKKPGRVLENHELPGQDFTFRLSRDWRSLAFGLLCGERYSHPHYLAIRVTTIVLSCGEGYSRTGYPASR